MHGGDLIAAVLKAQGVKFLFTLCGGHISPILVSCKSRDIRVIDVRHEANAVFAADAVSRLTGTPGVAAVTAGPGATNTITAVKNAQLAQSPVVLLIGATATALKGRGSLQDIDQMALFKPHVKSIQAVRKVKDLPVAVEKAFRIALEGVPGPVVVECPVDLLYEEPLVRDMYGVSAMGNKTIVEKAIRFYFNRHLNKLFAGKDNLSISSHPQTGAIALPAGSKIEKAADKLQKAAKPVLLVGSQAVVDAANVQAVAAAVERLNIPVYLSGMARGLLGKNHALNVRHKRRQALKEADLVILAGVPNDFRLDYGRNIRRNTFVISANRSRKDMTKNRRPNLGVLGDAGVFLQNLAEKLSGDQQWNHWLDVLKQRDKDRETDIDSKAKAEGDFINPLQLFQKIDSIAAPDHVFVADGGDFVATASYIVNLPGPLRWLDPGVFGTLGVGAGFALGAKLVYPEAEVWIIYGDGSVGYTLTEFDTFVRHQIPVIAVVGNDASWMQIAREQVEILKDDVGTVLRRSDYHAVAEGFGGKGFLLNDSSKIDEVLQRAKTAAKAGHPVLINAHLSKTDFRKGSISM